MSSILIEMLNNAALLIMLSLLYDMPGIRAKDPETAFSRQVFMGFLTGLVGIAVMLNPMHFGQGIVFDTRSVLLSISGLFFGTVPVIFAMIMTAAFRLFMGGAGAWTGVAVIATSGCLGLVWRYLGQGKKEEITTGGLYLMGLAVHGAMLLWMLSLPFQTAKEVLSAISLPVLLIFPAATVLLGWVMKNRGARQRSEEHLRQSRARYEKAQKMGKVGNWEYNIQTTEFWGSDEAKRIYGFDPDQDGFTTDEVETCIPERERVHQALVDLLEKGKDYHLEFDIITKDTRERNTIISIAELEKDKEGKPLKISGVIQDVTTSKKAAEALQKSEERLRAIFQAARNVSFIITDMEDPDPHILEFSPGAETIFGYDKTEVIGKPVSMLHLPRDAAKFPQAHERMRQGKTGFSGETTLVRKSGEQFPALFSTYPLFDLHGEVYAGLGVSFDVSEKQKLEAQLLQAQKMESIGRLAGGVAHDFNNMLSIILGNTEMILEDMGPNHPFAVNLSEAHHAAQRSADLTKQLLGFARKQTVEPRMLNLNDTVGAMLNMLKRLIGEDIDLAWQPMDDLWPVFMDPSQADQILVNLSVNARDAIQGTGRVTIETANVSFDEAWCRENPGFSPGAFVMIALSDTGCGMDKTTLDHLFEPFFTTKAVGRGTGLGLANVYGIVKQNKGFINVYSELDQGTRFKIYLPCHSHRIIPAEKPVLVQATDRGRETLLLVEDEEAILRVTTLILERLGYTVLAAAGPKEAIQLAQGQGHKISLIITDVIMPEMGGRDLAVHLSALYPNLKCLFMSGYTADAVSHHGILDKGLEFIHKPFSTQELSAKIRKILDGDKNAT